MLWKIKKGCQNPCQGFLGFFLHGRLKRGCCCLLITVFEHGNLQFFRAGVTWQKQGFTAKEVTAFWMVHVLIQKNTWLSGNIPGFRWLFNEQVILSVKDFCNRSDFFQGAIHVTFPYVNCKAKLKFERRYACQMRCLKHFHVTKMYLMFWQFIGFLMWSSEFIMNWKDSHRAGSAAIV